MEAPDKEMTLDLLYNYLPLSSPQTIASGQLCTTTGKWYIPTVGSSVSSLDQNGDGVTDVKLANNSLFSYSAQTGMKVVPGNTYTVDFDYISKTNLSNLTFDVRDCSSGTLFMTAISTNTLGHQSFTFTVPTNATTQAVLRFTATQTATGSKDFVIGKLLVQGEGVVFDIFYGPEKVNYANIINEKTYELANHLGNVLNTVTDRKIAYNSAGTIAYYSANVMSHSDYYAFGSLMPGRLGSVSDYSRGYQGSLKDNEIAGEGNIYNTYFRELDVRLGRWWSIDPKTKETPFESPYASMNNSPIRLNDVLGDKPTPKEAALMAKHVYGGMSDKKLKGGWKVSSIDLGNDFTKSDASGLKAQIYERTKKGKTEYAIVYAGTEDGEDWGDNFSQPLGSSKQYDLAIKNAIAVNDKIKSEVTYVGHSLGGGLATASALKYDKAAVTFNPAWVGTVTLTKYGLWTNWWKTEKIDNYVVAGEVLDAAMRVVRGSTGLVVQTGNTHFLYTWKTAVYPQDVVKAHFIDYLLWELKDVDAYNKVYNVKTGKNEVDK